MDTKKLQHWQTQSFGKHNGFSVLGSLAFDKNRGLFDTTLFFIMMILLGIGLICCFSAYYYFSSRNVSQNVSLYYFIGRQLLWAFVGLVLMFLAARVHLEFFYSITPLLWFVTLFLNILPLTGLFGSIRGGSRWIHLGSITFQPSELAKLTLALYLARVLERWDNEKNCNFRFFLRPLIMTMGLCLPIYLQNNLSTAVFIFGMSLVIFFLAGVSFWYIVLQGVATFALSVISLTSTWRLTRLQEFLEHNGDTLGAGMQPYMARRAIESAGFLGKGLGNGTFKLGRISMVQSDYIFAALVEEVGLLGSLAILAGFLVLAYRSWQIVQKKNDRYQTILMLSLALLIVGQAFLHSAVVIGLLPVTGVPMPFFSAGGSSLAITMLMCGIMLNVSREVKVE